MTSAGRLVFAFRPELRLGVEGDAAALSHLRAEYGPALAQDTSEADVDVTFCNHVDPARGLVVAGGHKTVRWDVLLAPPDDDTLRMAIEVRGWPRSFGLSLVQGYFVEPLAAVAAARRGLALLPAAAIRERDEAVLLIGRSRSGKSSVCARALTAGRSVLGDDHVLLDAQGWCYPFPRRIRVYPDLRATAKTAYYSLPLRTRAALTVRGGMRALTRGYVAPPVRVLQASVGNAPPPVPLPLGRVVVVERDGGAHPVPGGDVDGAALAVARALEASTAQREKLATAGHPGWTELLEHTRAAEEALLQEVFGAKPVERYDVPADLSASEAIAGLADRLAIETT